MGVFKENSENLRPNGIKQVHRVQAGTVPYFFIKIKTLIKCLELKVLMGLKVLMT